MSTYETILVERSGRVATVTLNRPDKLNALNAAVIRELTASFSEFECEGPETRVLAVVLTGAGEKAFGAGADIAEMSKLSPAEASAFSLAGHRLGWLMEEASFVIIAAVNGFCLGGGAELALCADFIYASERAKFGQPEINLGLVPGFGGSQRLARRVGLAQARELLFIGEPIDATEALRLGWVNRVFAAAELLPKALEAAQKIASKSAVALAHCKRITNRGYDADIHTACELEAQAFGIPFGSHDGREGIAAFLEKRKPNFLGR